jgi:hypothetical protein
MQPSDHQLLPPHPVHKFILLKMRSVGNYEIPHLEWKIHQSAAVRSHYLSGNSIEYYRIATPGAFS